MQGERSLAIGRYAHSSRATPEAQFYIRRAFGQSYLGCSTMIGVIAFDGVPGGCGSSLITLIGSGFVPPRPLGGAGVCTMRSPAR
jgi:hypothetical protein